MPAGERPNPSEPSPLNPCLILAENRLAHTTLMNLTPAAAKARGALFYLHGPSGTGKSLLIANALAHFRGAFPRHAILSLSAIEFSEQLSASAARKDFRQQRKPFWLADLLVLEDLQLLAERIPAQEQLVRLLDELSAHGKQVLISARALPAEIQGLNSPLVDRLHGGTTLGVRLPGFSSRLILLKHFANRMGFPWPEEVADYIAHQVQLSPPELLGLTRLASAEFKRGGVLNLVFAKRLLKQEEAVDSPTPARICQVVAKQFRIPQTQIRARSRAERFALPRQCAMYLSRELTGLSLQEIGQYFGKRDHTTVLHACRKIGELLPEKPELAQQIHQIRSALRRG